VGKCNGNREKNSIRNSAMSTRREKVEGDGRIRSAGKKYNEADVAYEKEGGHLGGERKPGSYIKKLKWGHPARRERDMLRSEKGDRKGVQSRGTEEKESPVQAKKKMARNQKTTALPQGRTRGYGGGRVVLEKVQPHDEKLSSSEKPSDCDGRNRE